MGKNQSASGLTNVIQYNNNGITFVSASTTLGTLNSSGSLSVTQNITGSNVLATGNIVAQTLVVQTVTSSINYSSGSNIFGNQLTNTQQFTGSVRVTGSLTVATTNPEFTVGATGVTLGNVLTDVHQVTGSLRVTGSVGIGTSSPATVLHIENSSPTLTIRNPVVADAAQGTANNLSAGLINFGANGAFNVVGSIESKYGTDASFGRIADMIFSTRNTTSLAERMRITSGGDVLIGRTGSLATSNTTSKLVVAGPVNLGSGVNNTSFPTKDDGGLGVYVGSGANAFQVWDDNQFSYPRFIVQRAGNVGIGTTNPTGAAGLALALNGGANQTRIALKNNTTGDGAGNGFQILLNTDGEANIEQRENAALKFLTNTTERMRITSGGAAGGNLKLNGTSISSFTSNPGNVAASGTTTLVISQISGQFQSTYLVTINGLYTSAGANQNGYGSALVNFFTDGSVAQANATQLQGNGWSITASATTGGTFTITFTNSASTTMSNIAIRALKLNMTGGD